jgi:Na+-driven multidrug efflux pump
MNTISMTPVDVLAGLGALLIVLFAWRLGARRARNAARAAHAGARLGSLAGRVLFNAVLIVSVQWVVITYRPNGWLLLTVLGLPALFASYALARALTVSTIDMPRRRGGGRR